eukprot:gene9207-6621_t
MSGYGITVSVGEAIVHDPGMGGKHAKYVGDFSWLSEEFARELPGCIIPPLPEKVTVGRFERDFIEGRQRGLQRYLQRVIAHPELSSSHLLVIFLQSDEGAFSRAMEDSKASRPKITTTAVNWFEGKVNSIAYGKTEIDRTPEDVKIEEMADYISKLEKQLQAVTKHSEGMAKRLKDTASCMFELGSSLSALGQSDVDGAGGELTIFASTMERTSNSYSATAEAELQKFHEPLDEYVRMMGSVKAAIQRRTDKKRAYVAALTDVDAKGAALRKAQSSGKDSSSKESSLAGAEAMRDAAKADFERVTDRLLQEFETFKEKKVADMKRIISSYVEFQMVHTRKVETLWEEALPQLQVAPPRSHNQGHFLDSRSSANFPSTPPPVPMVPPPLPPGSNPYDA